MNAATMARVGGHADCEILHRPASYASRSAVFLGAINGINNRPFAPEPHTSLPQALLAALCLGCFVIGVLCFAVGLLP